MAAAHPAWRARGVELCLPSDWLRKQPSQGCLGCRLPRRGLGRTQLSLVLKTTSAAEGTVAISRAHVQAASDSNGICHPRMSLAASGWPVGQAECTGVPASGTTPTKGGGIGADAQRAACGGQCPARASVSKGPRLNWPQ